MAADAIIQFGRRFIGSHYLWGAAGATPNQQDGAYYRTGAVNLDADAKSNEKPSVFAASCDVDGHYVCAGNFKEFIDQTGGGYTYPSDVNLTKYLDEISKAAVEFILVPLQIALHPAGHEGEQPWRR